MLLWVGCAGTGLDTPRNLSRARNRLMFSLATPHTGQAVGVLHADVAQLVERNLAKVEVASSSLVVRSEKMVAASVVEWPRGEATDCKSVYTGSNPVSTSMTRTPHRGVPSCFGRLAQW